MFKVIAKNLKTNTIAWEYKTFFKTKEDAFDYADMINHETAPWESDKGIYVADMFNNLQSYNEE